MDINKKPANYLVYCRVSSQRQVVEGDGLGSQEQRCFAWVKSKGGIIEKVFRDEGVSGGLFERPALIELLQYIDDNVHKIYTVVFDDLSRFARSVEVHLRLKTELYARGAKPECLNYSFDGSPEGEYVELIFAGKNELDRKQNRRQVIQKQKARLDRGYWPFCPPLGFIHARDVEHGKVLVPREPYASVIREAIEGYERNLFNTQDEVQQFMQRKFKEIGIDRKPSLSCVGEMLTKPLYAGYIEYEPWEVGRRDGQHQGLVSKETFLRVQDKLLGRSKPKMVKTYSSDFPLRGFVICAVCGQKIRASWNSGRHTKYPNYWCQTKGCDYRYKVTRREILHDKFEEILIKSKLGKGELDLARAVMADYWQTEKTAFSNLKNQDEKLIDSMTRKIDALTERVAETNNPSLIQTYEAKITKLSAEKAELESNYAKPQYTDEQFGTSLKKVCDVLENPMQLWNSDQLEDRRTMLYMFFENGLQYDYKRGFGTAELAESINLLRDTATQKIEHVEMPGSEPGSAATI